MSAFKIVNLHLTDAVFLKYSIYFGIRRYIILVIPKTSVVNKIVRMSLFFFQTERFKLVLYDSLMTSVIKKKRKICDIHTAYYYVVRSSCTAECKSFRAN